MLGAFFTLLLYAWAACLAVGLAWYSYGRLAGTIPEPQPVNAHGIERLGSARLVLIGLSSVGCLFIAIMTAPGVWFLALAVILAALIARLSPPNATVGRFRWGIICLIIVLAPTIIGEACDAPPFDRLLWVSIGSLGFAWWGQKNWFAPAPLPALHVSPPAPPITHASPTAVPQATAHQPPAPSGGPQGRQLPVGSGVPLRLSQHPDQVVTEVAKAYVGQPQALASWTSILQKNIGLFKNQSTRPLVVLHVGPPGCGRATLAYDLARSFGNQPVQYLPRGANLSELVNFSLVVFETGDLPNEEYLAEAVSTGGLVEWHKKLFVGLVDAPHFSDLSEVSDQPKLRAALDGIVSPKLAAVATVVPFRSLDNEALAGVAIRTLAEEGQRVGVRVGQIDPTIIVNILKGIGGSLRSRGAEAVRPAAIALLGTALDDARIEGLQTVQLTYRQNHLIAEPILAQTHGIYP